MAGLDTATSTPGSTPPPVSSARPVMAPVSACENAGAATTSGASTAGRTHRSRALTMTTLLVAGSESLLVGVAHPDCRYGAERRGSSLLPRVVPHAEGLHRVRVFCRFDVLVGDANVRMVLAAIVRGLRHA